LDPWGCVNRINDFSLNIMMNWSRSVTIRYLSRKRKKIQIMNLDMKENEKRQIYGLHYTTTNQNISILRKRNGIEMRDQCNHASDHSQCELVIAQCMIFFMMFKNNLSSFIFFI
jgi:hypothetical protein